MSGLSRAWTATLLSASLALPCLASAQSPEHEVIVHAPAPGVETRSERVSYTDLNLDRPAGARTLLMRINGAAERVCGPDDGSHSQGAYQTCVRDAVDHAVTDLDNPLVTSLHSKG
jgi:UrcA family protein